MSTTYPSSKQTFSDPLGTQTLASPSHSSLHKDQGDTIEAIQDAIGTTSGTSVLKNFSAGHFPVRNTGGGATGTLVQTIVGGTYNNTTIGTSAITGGTANNITLETVVGTPTLQQNIVQGSNLATNSILLAYGSYTTLFTGITATPGTLCSGTFTMPSGGRLVRATGWVPQIYSSDGATRGDLHIYEGTTELASAYGDASASTLGWGGATVIAIVSPTISSHIYNLVLTRSTGVGTLSAYADSNSYTKIIIELI